MAQIRAPTRGILSRHAYLPPGIFAAFARRKGESMGRSEEDNQKIIKGVGVENFETVTSVIKGVFPSLPDVRIERLARLIVSSCDDYNEALDIARKIPRQAYGTFRFNVVDKQWIVFYNSYGGEVDH